MILKPFNLSEAKAGKPVRNRAGEEVREFHLFGGRNGTPLVVRHADETIQYHSINGSVGRAENEYDLFMVEEPKMRAMRAEEFPAIWWVKGKGKGEETYWSLVYNQDHSGFAYKDVSSEHVVYFGDEAERKLVWSPDRKEIKSFFVEDNS